MTSQPATSPELVEALRALVELGDKVGQLTELMTALGDALGVPLGSIHRDEGRGLRYARQRVQDAESGRAAPDQVDQILDSIAEARAAGRRGPGGPPVDVHDPTGERRRAKLEELKLGRKRVYRSFG